MKLHMELSVKSIWKGGGEEAVNEKDFTLICLFIQYLTCDLSKCHTCHF